MLWPPSRLGSASSASVDGFMQLSIAADIGVHPWLLLFPEGREETAFHG